MDGRNKKIIAAGAAAITVVVILAAVVLESQRDKPENYKPEESGSIGQASEDTGEVNEPERPEKDDIQKESQNGQEASAGDGYRRETKGPQYTRLDTTWEKSGFTVTTLNYKSNVPKKDRKPKPDDTVKKPSNTGAGETKPEIPGGDEDNRPETPDNGDGGPEIPDDGEDNTPDAPSGGEERPEIKRGFFIIKYVDQTGGEIAASEKIEEDAGVERTFTAKEIEDYELVSDEEQSAVLSGDELEKTVVFTYTKLLYGTVLTRYVDENFRDLATPVSDHKVVIDREYIVKPKSFAGYRQLDTQPVKVMLENEYDSAEVIFHLEKEVTYGTVRVLYLNEDGTRIRPAKELTGLDVERPHQIRTEVMEGYTLQEDYVKTVTFSKGETEKEVIFRYRTDAGSGEVYLIELDKYDIKNDGTNPTESTKGINKAIREALDAGYHKIKLPAGTYAVDPYVKEPLLLEDADHKKWTHNRSGISLESDMQFDMTDCVLVQEGKKDAYTSVLTVSGCKNTKILGGTIVGDKYTHYYGTRVNENGGELESGDFDPSTGEPAADETKMRTKDYITEFVNEDGTVKDLPMQFYIMPLWNTTMNTVDGGCRYIYCYDEAGNYLGMSSGGAGYVKRAELVSGTKKIKVSLKGEKRSDAVFYITEENIYPTFEFGACVTVAASDQVEIVGTAMRASTGDCITTFAPPVSRTVDHFSVIGCDLSDSRRQGISFVATGEKYIVKDTKIHDIGGVDPQCGIDFEHYDYCRDTIIDGSQFYNNKKLDIINYNGTDIEVKNSRFTGLVGATFGTDMQVHDNYFEYTDGQDKIHTKAGVQLQTKNNVVWDNHFVKGSLTVTGEGSEAYGNLLEQGTAAIKNTYRNIYRDMERVEIVKTEKFDVFEGSEFQNCKVISAANFGTYPGPLTVRNCKFKDSVLNGRGDGVIEFCDFNNRDTPIQDGWAGEELINYYRCNIDCSNTTFLAKGSKRNNYFRDCTIKTKRENIMVYGATTSEDSEYTFVTGDSDRTKTILMNTGVYGEERSPWNFTNCVFKAQDPVRVHATNGHATNRADGPVELN